MWTSSQSLWRSTMVSLIPSSLIHYLNYILNRACRERRRARSRCVHILDHAFWSRSQPRSQSNASNTSSATPKITTGAMSGPRKLSARGQSKGLLSRRLSKATEQAGKVHLPEDGRDLAVDQGGGKGKQRAEESQPPQDVQDQQPKVRP